MPLYLRVCLINGLVFILGTLALALSPGTVSTRILVSEAVMLMIGLIVPWPAMPFTADQPGAAR
jgi:two-component system, NarL family, sensor histidine kinase UhpB